MNPPDSDDRALARLLHSDPLADDGFTARVLASLPPVQAAAPRRQLAIPPLLVALLAASTGAGYALLRGASWEALRETVAKLGAAVPLPSPELAVQPWFVVGLAFCALSVTSTFLFVSPRAQRFLAGR